MNVAVRQKFLYHKINFCLFGLNIHTGLKLDRFCRTNKLCLMWICLKALPSKIDFGVMNGENLNTLDGVF